MGRPIARRGFVVALGGSVLAALAGCLGGGGDRGTTTAALDPAPVPTTGGDDVEVVVAQMVVRGADDGPRVHYRLRNVGGTDATVAVRTVLEIDSGGTYEATAYADVPADGEVVLEYRVVRYDGLSAAERDSVRRGDADFDVYVGGQLRPDA